MAKKVLLEYLWERKNSMNNICIIGTITRDLELKETSNQIKYIRFGIAVNRPTKNDNGEYEADFFNVVAWRKTAEFISNYFGKGKRIGITGRLQTGKYTDKDGVERTSTEIVANEVYLIEKKEQKQEEKSQSEEIYAAFGDSVEIDDSDLAF